MCMFRLKEIEACGCRRNLYFYNFSFHGEEYEIYERAIDRCYACDTFRKYIQEEHGYLLGDCDFDFDDDEDDET